MKLITAGGLFFFLLGLAVLAEQILAQQIPIQPRPRFHADPAFGQATDELVNGRFSAAEAAFQKLAEARPQDADSHFFLGVAQLRQNKHAQAIDSFKQTLDLSPDQVEARWNLLVAAEKGGIDLGQLAEKYRLLPVAGPWVQSSVQSPIRFENVGASSGTDKVDIGRGSGWADYDGDGDLDVFAVGVNSPHALFRNKGDGTFTNVTAAAGLSNSLSGWSALFADYDNDGDPDLYVTRNGWAGYVPNTLYRNNGDGTFTDVTQEAGVGDPSDSFTAAWADYDRDGFLDLYVANGVSSRHGSLNNLFHNNGNGTFTDVAIPAGVFDGHHSIGCAWGDADNDGYPDLYVVNYGDDNGYYHNNADGTFSDWTAKAGVAAPKYGFVTFFFDYDHDADLDLFVSSWASQMVDVIRFYMTGKPQGESRQKLFRNKGDGTFEDVTAQAGLEGTYGAMGANFGDIDNDGFPEIYLGTGGPPLERYEPNVLFLNQGNGSFVDVTASSGTGDTCKGHGQTFVDFDGDGDLDIYSPCGGAWSGDRQPNSLFRNPGSANHWLVVRTRGVKSNRDAIGARVTLTVNGSSQVAEVTSGGGFGSTNSLELEFGLGKASKVEKLHIRWPSGQEQEFTEVDADQFVTITEGQQTLSRSSSPAPHGFPIINSINDHSLLDSGGKRVNLLDLKKGKIAVASLIYTSCSDTTACPLAMATLQRLDRLLAERPRLAERVTLFLLSFDPERDTPAHMAALRTSLGPRTEWYFLTSASEAELEPLLEDLNQPAAKISDENGIWDGRFHHVFKIFLVDEDNNIRNVYGVGYADPQLIMNDIETLAREEKS